MPVAPVVLPLCTTLLHALPASATSARLVADSALICANVALPGHFFGTVYTASRSERVMVTACTAPEITLVRGFDGTTAYDWPAGACFKLDTFVAGAVCPDVPDTAGGQCPSVFDQLTLGNGLRINYTDPTSPKLELAATGVVAGNIGGALVNAYGQLTSYPANWPASALPVFAPCCDDTGAGGGAVDACAVSYTPQVGGAVVSGTNVCTALVQIEDYIVANSGGGGSGGVSSVAAGSGVTLTGSASAPIVNVSSTGIAAGTYAGFAINVRGQVTGYVPPAAGSFTLTGTAPITVVTAGGGASATVSVLTGAVGQLGAVKLADAANVGPNENLIAGTDVVDYDFLIAWMANWAATRTPPIV